MSTTTYYDVKLRYIVDSQGATGTRMLADETRRLAREASGARNVIRDLAGGLVGAFSLREAGNALISFNANVQSSKIQLAAMTEAITGGSWSAATANADRLYTEFQRFSVLAPVTTNQIMEFGNGVMAATLQAGGSMKDFTDITEQGVIAAKAFGAEGRDAAFGISEMLQGAARKQNSVVRTMLALNHMTAEQFNALDPTQRLGVVKGTLNSSAFKDAARAYGESWEGVTSTLEDKLQILAGRVGLPLFKAITKEIQGWNAWITNNTGKIDLWATKFADGLITGFNVLHKIGAFIVDHADVLLSIGKVWAATRVAGAVGNMGGYLGSALGSVASGGGGAASAGGLLQFGVAVGTATYELDEYLGVNRELAHAIDPVRAKYEDLQTSMEKFDVALANTRARLDGQGTAAASTFGTQQVTLLDQQRQRAELARDFAAGRIDYDDLQKSGLFGGDNIERFRPGVGDRGWVSKAVSIIPWMAGLTGDSGKDAGQQQWADMLGQQANRTFVTQATASTMTDTGVMGAMATLPPMQRELIDQAKLTNWLLQYYVHEMPDILAGKAANLTVEQIKAIGLALSADEWGTKANKPVAKRPDVNVTIQRIEVASDDPDRFVFGIVEAVKDYSQSPSQSFHDISRG